MDRRPTMEARPPVLIDAIVRTLIPPACREHVVGDLWERYRSPAQFTLDAARQHKTDPFRSGKNPMEGQRIFLRLGRPAEVLRQFHTQTA